MTLITEDYREQNRQLHATRPDYGNIGQRFASLVINLGEKHKTTDILDYGCGKRSLERALGFTIRNYDPAINGLDTAPEPADIVVCTDVLEHIELDCLDSVLADLARVTKKVCLANIATRPAKKNLPDGRNAHLIVRPARWWMRTVLEFFEIELWQVNQGEVLCLLTPSRP